MTLVLQDDIGGLQAFSKGEWIDVPPDDGTNGLLVVNLGEQAEIWSRGYFLATPHRVLMHHRNKNRNRISVPLFYNPVLSAKIIPFDEYDKKHHRADHSSTCNDDENEDEGDEQTKPKPSRSSRHLLDQLIWERPREYERWRREKDTMISTVGENTFKSLARSHLDVFTKNHPDLLLLENGQVIHRRNNNDNDDDDNNIS